MDPAGAERVMQALASQGAMVGQHEAVLKEVMKHHKQLNARVAQLSGLLNSLADQRISSSPPTEAHPPPAPAAEVSTPQSLESYIPMI